MTKAVRVGLIGYGLAGRFFHAPFIACTPGMQLAAVSTSRHAEVEQDHPTARVAASAQEVLADPDLDLVVIATPNDSHFPLAAAALEAGKAVVIDKPFATSTSQARTLAELAASRGLLLSVFHNRRWDGDFLTLSDLIARGALGKVALFESRFDRFKPQVPDLWREIPGAGAGAWWDLGPHLLDQAMVVFGAPDAIEADLTAQREGARATDYFHVVLRYGSSRVILTGGSLVADVPARFSVQGTAGAFVSHGLDLQEALLRSGQLPGAPTEPARAHLTTSVDGRLERRDIPVIRGDWGRFYTGVRDAVQGDGPNPVSPADALAVMRALELAEESNRLGRRLDWRDASAD
jgi:scyllo-inositol 2-dehydrogenase (NADP+)